MLIPSALRRDLGAPANSILSCRRSPTATYVYDVKDILARLPWFRGSNLAQLSPLQRSMVALPASCAANDTSSDQTESQWLDQSTCAVTAAKRHALCERKGVEHVSLGVVEPLGRVKRWSSGKRKCELLG